MVKWLDVGIYCPQLMEMIRFQKDMFHMSLQ